MSVQLGTLVSNTFWNSNDIFNIFCHLKIFLFPYFLGTSTVGNILGKCLDRIKVMLWKLMLYLVFFRQLEHLYPERFTQNLLGYIPWGCWKNWPKKCQRFLQLPSDNIKNPTILSFKCFPTYKIQSHLDIKSPTVIGMQMKYPNDWDIHCKSQHIRRICLISILSETKEAIK